MPHTGRPNGEPAPYQRWGRDLAPAALTQMENACRLPVSVKGALMPDAHLGYGLPIGGVLATRGAVIPYAVGMDIACRMCMTVLDWKKGALAKKARHMAAALEKETAFGVGAHFKESRDHEVMGADWGASPFLSLHKDVAWRQLGSSGAGNHFAEFGRLEVAREIPGLERGTYVALLTHSGSRGTGAEVARHFSGLAMEKHPDLPKPLKHLAWLELSSPEGQEYWFAMELMGRYAAANHELVHRGILARLGATALWQLSNHHNFAWRETHDGQEVVVHRKGATPAHVGTMGIIPGSMTAPGYVVRGLGNPASLFSASHGAGRKMSRKAAKARYTREDLQRVLKKAGVKLLSAELDEVPMAYKNIETVMADQGDLVEPLAKFTPSIVKMAP